MSPAAVRLVLPLPPSNQHSTAHGMAQVRRRNAYKRECWQAAVKQVVPSFKPPARVRVCALFNVRNLRDDDNLAASLKLVLDALKLRQRSTRFRGGLYSERGYFVDDDPQHLALEKPAQRIDRKAPSLLLTVEPLTEARTA